MNFTHAIMMLDKDGYQHLISRHKSLENAKEHLEWLGFDNCIIIEWGTIIELVSDDKE